MWAVRFAEVARASREVTERRSRLAKIDRLAELLRGLRPEEVPVAVAYLAGTLPQGTVGIGWASLRSVPPAVEGPSDLELLEVHDLLDRIRLATGPGSQAARRGLIAELFARATSPERDFLQGLLTGELRQGALAGVMVEAVARAAGVPAPEVRRGAMLASDLGRVAAAAVADGRAGLAAFRLMVLQPVQPMLAQTATDVAGALALLAPAAAVVEWKLDGARLQVHRLGPEVRAFTRNLADVTHRVPEVVEAVLGLPVEAVVLDGEAIALRAGARPHPFQVTMGRFGSQLAVARLRGEVPLSAFFFDLLHLDGDDLIDRPLRVRTAALAALSPEDLRVPSTITEDPEVAERVLAEALERGHEGVMVKSADAPYEAGRRGATWLKVKRAHTLDLVVLAAEWGHGRRQGWLSNLHLGARDPDGGGFVMLGKTFKGMTDEMLAWQTERLLGLETSRNAFTVHVRPEVVVEVAFDGVQASPRYPAGLALRFARVKGYRHDKGPADADTIETVRAIHRGQSPAG
jgi:DNA ligase 1